MPLQNTLDCCTADAHGKLTVMYTTVTQNVYRHELRFRSLVISLTQTAAGYDIKQAAASSQCMCRNAVLCNSAIAQACLRAAACLHSNSNAQDEGESDYCVLLTEDTRVPCTGKVSISRWRPKGSSSE